MMMNKTKRRRRMLRMALERWSLAVMMRMMRKVEKLKIKVKKNSD